MKTHVINYNEFANHEPLYDYMQCLSGGEELYETVLSLFEGAPDLIKIDGEENIFVDVEAANERYVLCLDECDKYKSDLALFFSPAFKEHFESTEDYEGNDNVIAYRGGKGYFYDGWKRKY